VTGAPSQLSVGEHHGIHHSPGFKTFIIFVLKGSGFC